MIVLVVEGRHSLFLFGWWGRWRWWLSTFEGPLVALKVSVYSVPTVYNFERSHAEPALHQVSLIKKTALTLFLMTSNTRHAFLNELHSHLFLIAEAESVEHVVSVVVPATVGGLDATAAATQVPKSNES